MAEYWYNVKTHQVEEGAQSDWTQLLGPYSSFEEATRALQVVRERNEYLDDDEDE